LPASAPIDVAIIGGGPAGSAAGRLLSAWGRSVVVLDNPAPRARGLAESIPPSTRKLLAEVGVLDVVEASDFYRSTGNTVWWADDAARLETFGAAGRGYQVFRPDFDRVLAEAAASAGADVRTPARVAAVSFDDDRARVDFEHDGAKASLDAHLMIDCSGRAGIIGRRFRRAQEGHRTHALIGVWARADWDLPDDTHTLVETYDEGWAWSVPISASTRHVGVMVDRGTSYRAEIAKTTHVRASLEDAVLQHEWACDASLYFASMYGGPRFLLAGDAGSFIDPLSSFGVKKALASAWMAAVVAHTVLAHPEREAAALDYFSSWERDVYMSHLRRSREFARAACEKHPGAFWRARAEVEIDDTPEGAPNGMPHADRRGVPYFARETVHQDAARNAWRDHLSLSLADDVCFEPTPVIRGNELVLERAFAGGLRFADHVDLVALAEMATEHTRVPDLFDAYCRTHAPVPWPNVAGALSLLIARGILHERT